MTKIDHRSQGMRGKSAEVRFWAKVQGGDVDTCWEWTAAKTRPGYGQFSVRPGLQVRAHRFAYEALIGPIPEGLELDHLCRNRACVNPWHLEPVTSAVNMYRAKWQTYCKRGHLLNPDRPHAGQKGISYCVTCYNAGRRARYHRNGDAIRASRRLPKQPAA